jgi:N-acetylglucosaminyl-diphospho-decaprenol L-rhamnosyltransferase
LKPENQVGSFGRGVAAGLHERPGLAVVLVNHNGAACLPRALTALARNTRASAECIVVDSGSSDDSWLGAERHWHRARVIRHEQNIGFCAGCNRGASAAEAPLVAFVNFDGEVEPDWDVPLRSMLEDPRISIGGGMLVDPSGTIVEALGLAIAPNLATYGLSEAMAREQVVDSQIDVAAVSGALMMVRREEFLAAGGFYEPIWMYGEEADLAMRMPGRIVVDPRSALRHEIGHAAGPRASVTRVYWPSRNRLINAARHTRGRKLVGAVMASAAFDLALMAAQRDRATIRAVSRGWRDGLSAMPMEMRASRSRDSTGTVREIVSLREALAQRRRLTRLQRLA